MSANPGGPSPPRKRIRITPSRVEVVAVRPGAVLIAGLTLGLGWPSWTSTVAQTTDATAFVNVNVVPMDRERVLWNHTIVVEGGVITALGPSSTTPSPPGAGRIEGRGTAYVLPGLADMHTHVIALEDLPSYTANGVTTILHMGGVPMELAAGPNPALETGTTVGPRIFFSLMVDGSPAIWPDAASVSDPAEARRAVGFAAANGYDFIKVYNGLTALDFSAVVEEAQRLGLPVIGHGVRTIGLPRALQLGQVMVTHAEEFFYTAFGNEEDAALIPGVVAATAESGAFVTPTLSTNEIISEQWGRPEVVAGYLADARARDLAPIWHDSWASNDYVSRQGGIDGMVAFLRTFVAALHEAGVPIMTGTDSPAIPGAFPGYSLHHELQMLVDVGLTPYEALVAATRTPGDFIAEHIPSARRFGTVADGAKADLVMVAGNPWEDLETLRAPMGVMTAGRWLDEPELQSVVAAQSARLREVETPD